MDVGDGRISDHPARFPVQKLASRAAPDGLVKNAPVRLLDTELPRSTEGVHDRKETQAISLFSLMRHGTIGHDSDTPTAQSQRYESFEHRVIGPANVEIGRTL
jgi:hypothetical protein